MPQVRRPAGLRGRHGQREMLGPYIGDRVLVPAPPRIVARHPAAGCQPASFAAQRQPVDLADELAHERRGRLLVDRRGRADLFDPAVVHHRDAIGQLQRLFLVVGDEHRDQAKLLVQLAQPAAQADAHLRVQRAERFVKQQQVRLNRQRAGQRHALALAAGQLRRIAAAEAVQLHALQQVLHPRGDPGTRRARAPRSHAQAECDVLGHAQVAEQRVMLEHQADAAFARVHREEILAIAPYAAAVGMVQPGQDAQQGGLAGTGWPQQGKELARRDRQADIVQRGKVAVAASQVGKFQGHAASFSARRAHGRRSRRHSAIPAGSSRPA